MAWLVHDSPVRIKQYVYFSVISETSTADEIANFLGLPPDKLAVRGSRLVDPPRPRFHSWQLVCDSPGLRIDQQASAVLERLRAVEDRLVRIGRSCSARAADACCSSFATSMTKTARRKSFHRRTPPCGSWLVSTSSSGGISKQTRSGSLRGSVRLSTRTSTASGGAAQAYFAHTGAAQRYRPVGRGLAGPGRSMLARAREALACPVPPELRQRTKWWVAGCRSRRERRRRIRSRAATGGTRVHRDLAAFPTHVLHRHRQA